MHRCGRCERMHDSVHRTCRRCREKNAAEQRKRKAMIDEAKAGGCLICGETDLRMLQFHHCGKKEFAISKAWQNYGTRRIKEEMAKCVVLCAHCHAKHHAEGGRMTLDRRKEIKHQLASLFCKLDDDDMAKLAELVAMDLLQDLDVTGRERIDKFVEQQIRSIVGPMMARYAKRLIAELREQCQT